MAYGAPPRRHPGRSREVVGNNHPRGMIVTRKRTEPGLQTLWLLFFHRSYRTIDNFNNIQIIQFLSAARQVTFGDQSLNSLSGIYP